MKSTLFPSGNGSWHEMGMFFSLKVTIVYFTLQKKPDISLAKEKLEWEPKIELEEGLKSTIHYFEQLLQNDTRILC